MLIYTQTSPDIPDLMADINRLAEATGKGHDLRIAVDSRDSYAWPWAWYLRDYNAVSYADLTNGLGSPDQPLPEYDVMLVHSANVSKVRDSLSSQASTQYGPERLYQHRWWFDERYKDAMTVGDGGLCTGEMGNCGPLRLETWKHIFSSTPGWLDTWYRYWRDHDADALFGGTRENSRCTSCGSVDGYAFFPANFDLAKGVSTPTPWRYQARSRRRGNATFGSRARSQASSRDPPTSNAMPTETCVIDPESRRLQKFDSQGNSSTG
jgi:hypothetical protein